MSYTDFAEKMLIALYQESENDEPYPEGITFGTLIERYGLSDNGRWLDRLAEEWESEGLAKVSDILEPTRDLTVEIAGRGMRKVEDTYGDKDGVGIILNHINSVPPNVLTTEDGGPLVTEGGDYIVAEDASAAVFDERFFDPAIFDTGERTDSSSWTGLPKTGSLSPAASQRVVDALRIAESALEQSGASNQEKAQARAYIIAIRALAEAPEPPADLIWQIVDRLNSVAGIASLFVALVGLFA